MASRDATRPAHAPGRREMKKHLTRRELLAAGRRLFAEKGLYESRIEDLSSRAGIAKGTLYGYFRDKDELIEAVVTEGFHALHALVAEAAAPARTRPATLEAAAHAHFEFFEENPDLLRVFHQVRGRLKFERGRLRRLRAALNAYLVSLAKVLATRPSPRATGPAANLESAKALFGAVSGIASVRASTATAPPPPAVTAKAVAALVLALEAARTTARPR